MKLGTVVTATDLNPLYVDFIPIFIQAWKKIVPEADIHIVMVASEIPAKFKPYESYIKLVPPLEGVSTAFQAQCIRNLYPRNVTKDEGVIITDMDMLPLSRRYFVESIKDIPSDTFVVYRNITLPVEIPMCYNIAHPSIWKAVFGEESYETLLKKWYVGFAWNTDQIQLKNYVMDWKGPKRIFSDSELSFSRLDRETDIFHHKKYLFLRLKENIFCDYHAWRPHSKYEHINQFIIDQMP